MISFISQPTDKQQSKNLQVIKCRLVAYLLNVLDTGLHGVENVGSTRAQIVKTLKSMTTSLEYGEEVSFINFHIFFTFFVIEFV